MKQLFRLMTQWYYWAEFRNFLLLGTLLAAIWGFTQYGSLLGRLFLSDAGFTWVCFGLGAVVLGLVIKTYYQIVAIRYSGENK